MYDFDDEDMGYYTPFCPYCPMFRQKPYVSPPYGPPSGGPHGPSDKPPPPPPPQGGQQGPPSGPPPKVTPKQSTAKKPGLYAVDPGAIRPCTFRYIYLWMRSGREFWAWLVYVGRTSASGWRWNGYRWVYFGVDLRNIVAFECY